MTERAPPRDASTAILLRDGSPGLEVFLVRRHDKSGFMGGAYVFPGGKLDAADTSSEVLHRANELSHAECEERLGEPGNPHAVGLHIAAIRETFEEAGVWIGTLTNESTREDELASARQRLLGGTAFIDILRTLNARMSLSRLVPHSRWVTPEIEPRRFDARFFLAVVDENDEATMDARETTDGVWLTPSVALDREKQGGLWLPPPTRRTLELLSVHTTSEDACRDAASRRPPLIRPIAREIDGDIVLILPGDAEHPERDIALAGPTRTTFRIKS